MLPLHICLTRNASEDVIELLLNEDNIEGKGEDRTVHTACGIGRNPLTIAICNNRPADIIEVLLNAETNESKNIESNFRGMVSLTYFLFKLHYHLYFHLLTMF